MPLTYECTPMSDSASQFSYALTDWYANANEGGEKAAIWFPSMLGHAVSAVYSLAVLIVDLALTAMVGLVSLATCRKNESINRFLDVCTSSLLYDSQALSIGIVGMFAPPCAVDVRDRYRMDNALALAPQMIQQGLREFFGHPEATGNTRELERATGNVIDTVRDAWNRDGANGVGDLLRRALEAR
jgi:hypothetical protein